MTMRGLVITCLVAMLLVACNTRQRVAGGGAGLAVVGLGLSYSNEGRSEDEVGTKGKVGIACMLTGLVVLFVAAALDESANESKAKEIKLAEKSPPPRAATEVDPAVTAAQKRRDQAWAMTKAAQEAARAGDCPKVTELSAQVGALDPAFYGEVFMTDVAVQKCFTPAEPKPVTPVPTLTPAVTP